MRSNQRWSTSRYNFSFAIDEGHLIYNASSGATLKLAGEHGEYLAALLAGVPSLVSKDSFPDAAWDDFIRGGFLISEETSELQIIRDRYRAARRETPLVLTLTTTMDCNLGCYYCYEERSTDELKLSDVNAVVAFAEQRIEYSAKSSLHIDWYGGEPLLNFYFLEAASLALQELCQKKRVSYAASIISNGTCWPDDAVEFVKRHAIGQVQISFDGLEANHNRRRRYRDKKEAASGTSSFLKAVSVVDSLIDTVRVDARYNIDKGNQGDLEGFIEFARDRGWFDGAHPVVVQPARLASFSDHSSFMRSCELSLDEFDALRQRVRDAVRGDTIVEESESPNGYPYPRTSVCAALADSSAVIGADAKVYRCGLQVGEQRRAVGEIRAKTNVLLPIIDLGSDAEWWEKFDPTTSEQCSKCSFLPICLGGCPKKHLEQDAYAIAEQGAFWRSNLARLVASNVGETLAEEYLIPRTLQFRDAIDCCSLHPSA